MIGSVFDRAVFSVLALSLTVLVGLAWLNSAQMAASGSASTPHLIFSTVDDVGRTQLHHAPLDLTERSVGEARPLTAAENSVWDFSTAPHGNQLVYATIASLGTGDLRLVSVESGRDELLLDCENASCNGAAWSPDGRYLAFTKRNNTAFTTGPLSPPRIWLLETQSGQSSPIFQDSQMLGLAPRWSADGSWLCFFSPDPQGLALFNVNDGRTDFYPSGTGETCTWHGTKPIFYTNVSRQLDESWVTHLLAVDVETGAQWNLSGEESQVDDASPVVSPDGGTIAFRRKIWDGPGATRGMQIWTMRSDGSEAVPLTSNDAFDHGPPVWSPDGEFLLTRRYPLKGPEIVPSIWLLDRESGELVRLIEPGDNPAIVTP